MQISYEMTSNAHVPLLTVSLKFAVIFEVDVYFVNEKFSSNSITLMKKKKISCH